MNGALATRRSVLKMTALAFTLGTGACGRLTGLDQDFHEVDCFPAGSCSDGATDGPSDATLVEAGESSMDAVTAAADGKSDQTVAPVADGSSNEGTVGTDVVTADSTDGGSDQDAGPTTDGGGPDGDATTPDTGIDAGVCGDGILDPGEQCDRGTANIPVATAYGMKGACTTLCTFAPYCGDSIVNGPEVCDNGGSGSTVLGACNPECTGFYTKKVINQTSAVYNGNLGGPSGADTICQNQFGAGWKAFLVGGNRRATVTPYAGDNPQDWALQKYTYYYNAQNQLIWRTDAVPLLGVSGGAQQAVSAAVFDAGGSTYAWSGWNTDWTTVQDIPANATGTCAGWTTSSNWGQFITPNLVAANDGCNTPYFVLCVQQ